MDKGSKYYPLISDIKRIYLDLKEKDEKVTFNKIMRLLYDDDLVESFQSSSLRNFIKDVIKAIDAGDDLSGTEPSIERATLDWKDNGDVFVTGVGDTLENVLKKAGLDINEWEVIDINFKESNWDVAAKYRDQDLTFTKTPKYKKNGDRIPGAFGQIMEGHAIRKNEWIVRENQAHSFKVRLRPKLGLMNHKKFKMDFLAELKENAPYVPPVYRQKMQEFDDGHKYAIEIDLFDVHLGRFIWSNDGQLLESTHGTIERFEETVAVLVNDAIDYIKSRDPEAIIEKIIFPVGNDFFTVDKDKPHPTTTALTPQHTDMILKHIFKKGRMLLGRAIKMMREIAPVYAPVIPGNHDWETSFYLGDALDVMFENYEDVEIDNSVEPRKYFEFYNSLIGFTHGKYEKTRLYTNMQLEAPQAWARTKFREWHVGDHHKTEGFLIEIDYQGVMIKHLGAFTHEDDWETREGYRRIHGGTAFVWHEKKGKIAQLYDNVIPHRYAYVAS